MYLTVRITAGQRVWHSDGEVEITVEAEPHLIGRSFSDDIFDIMIRDAVSQAVAKAAEDAEA